LADRVEGLAYKLTADASGLAAGFDQAANRVNRFAADAKSGADKIAGAFAGVGSGAQNAFAGLISGGPLGAVSSLTGSLGGLVTSLGGVATIGAGAFAGIIAGAVALRSAAEGATSSINSINKLSRVLGESGQNTQILQNVLSQAGIEGGDQQTG